MQLMSSKRKVDCEPCNQGQTLSPVFKEKKLRLSDDKLSVLTTGASSGYQSVLAQYSASCGKWYFEATVEELSENSHFRIGWSTRRTRYDQPIGSDCFSFALRDLDSAKITLGKRFAYISPRKLIAGDTVGCYLSLPSRAVIASPRNLQDPLTHLPNLLCDPETVPDPDLCPGGAIYFSINGEAFPVAFTNLVQGEYFPAVSLFGKSARIRFNFDAPFAFPPPPEERNDSFRPASEMYVPKELMKPKRRPPNFIPRGLTSGA